MICAYLGEVRVTVRVRVRVKVRVWIRVYRDAYLSRLHTLSLGKAITS